MRRMFIVLFVVMLLALPLCAKADAKDEAKAYLLTPIGGAVAAKEKNPEDRYSVAGLAKLPALVTLCHAFDAGLLGADTPMEVSKKASRISGPTAFLEAGETLSAGELMKAAVMISAGDAIWTLMENAFGTEEVFLQNISVVMKEIGLDLTFTSCLGTGTAFSCRDLAAVGAYAANSPTFLKYSALYMETLRHASGKTTELVNANRMIRTCSGCLGLLTGSSRDDGYCGVFYAKRSETAFLCCVIGSPTSEARFSEAAQLFDYAFANYRTEAPAQSGVPLKKAYPVHNGDPDAVDLVPHETASLLLKKSDGALTAVFDLPEVLSAPLDPEIAVGSASFQNANGETLCTVMLYPAEPSASNGYPDVLKRILISYLD